MPVINQPGKKYTEDTGKYKCEDGLKPMNLWFTNLSELFLVMLNLDYSKVQESSILLWS